MGLITVHLLTVGPSNLQTQPNSTQKQTIIKIKDQPTLYHEFLLIAQSTKQSQIHRNLPVFANLRSPFHKKRAPASSLDLNSWCDLFKNVTFFDKIIVFLNGQDLLRLKSCSRFLKRQALIKILQRESNWDLTFGLLAPCLSQQNQLKESDPESDYQHSEDLDRTSGYFESQNSQELQEHQMKLDRIITAISFKIEYFQGVMPICANLLQCFNQHISYWLLRFLLHRCRYIQNDIDFYNKYICFLEREFQVLLPEVYRHLSASGFELNYFVMKWIMGLFSEDMSKTMMLALWDLICMTDVFILTYAIIEIFRILKHDILQSNEDQINQMLKINLKNKLAEIKSQELMKHIKELYIRRRLDGVYPK